MLQERLFGFGFFDVWYSDFFHILWKMGRSVFSTSANSCFPPFLIRSDFESFSSINLFLACSVEDFIFCEPVSGEGGTKLFPSNSGKVSVSGVRPLILKSVQASKNLSRSSLATSTCPLYMKATMEESKLLETPLTKMRGFG